MTNSKSIKFQIIDWYSEDKEVFVEEDSSTQNRFTIMIFGRNKKGQSVSVEVSNFEISFYIKIPKQWNKQQLDTFKTWIKNKIYYKSYNSITNISIIQKFKLRGFNNNQKFNFVKFNFANKQAFYQVRNLFLQKHYNPKIKRDEKFPKKITIQRLVKNYIFDLYESNLNPLLRFIHLSKIQNCGASGWIKIPKRKYNIRNKKMTTCDIDIVVKDWRHIKSIKNNKISKIKIMAYDIECDSSHGDFPLQKKGYKKLVRELFTEYSRIYNYIKIYDNEKSKKYNKYLENTEKFTFKLLKYAFKKKGSEEHNISKIYIKKKAYTEDQRSYLNKLQTQKLFLINQIEIVTKKINYFVSLKYNKTNKTLLNQHIEKVQEICENELPPVEGDSIIQIASVFLNFGEDKPYLTHILTLDTCNPIENAVVVQCKTEKELILKWRKLTIEQDIDIITGYNIYNFDYPYIWDRATELGIQKEYCLLSKILNKKSKATTRFLSSAAMGDNKWTEIDSCGRIQVDLMKVVQKDYNLGSYKLDNVSAHFLRGKIKEIIKKTDELTILKTDNIKGLVKDSFIVFTYPDGHTTEKHLKGKKYKISKIENDKIYINKKIKLKLNKYNYEWCMAKDDVTPQDIFDFQKQGPDKRCIIAKYCIKDTLLCIHLLLKLQIIPNYIGMSNVCLTPLNWIFTRGQSIKVFSLVSYECMKENYLIPVLYPGENTGFEGAVVLPPKCGIYLKQSCAVLDYSSLYPSSMIAENLSHECICEDDKYKGEEGAELLKKLGYNFIDITYDVTKKIKNKKIKIGVKTCRFVKPLKKNKEGVPDINGKVIDTERGLMPRILQKLLKARKDTRKKIKYKTIKTKNNNEYIGLVSDNDDTNKIIIDEEGNKNIIKNIDIISIKDTYSKFEQNIFNGLQLSYKICANSLYGSLGASTSAISYIDIAASVTATGRRMLEWAADFALKTYKDVNVCDCYVKDTTVVYGDSVCSDSPILIRYPNGKISIKKIETIANEWKSYEEFKPYDTNRKEKQQALTTFEVWTNGKWSIIKRVIRHKTQKKIYRVITDNGIVDCTEDHSLLSSLCKKIKPNECEINKTELLHSFPTTFKEFDCKITPEQAFKLGMNF